MSGEILPKGVMSEEEVSKSDISGATEVAISRAEMYRKHGFSGNVCEPSLGANSRVVVDVTNKGVGRPVIIETGD